MTFDFLPSPKPVHARGKLTQKQKGDISLQVRKALHERSEGLCEVCNNARAVHAAHLISRKRIEHKTTVNDLCHACVECHHFLDSCKEGREWKESFHELLKLK